MKKDVEKDQLSVNIGTIVPQLCLSLSHQKAK